MLRGIKRTIWCILDVLSLLPKHRYCQTMVLCVYPKKRVFQYTHNSFYVVQYTQNSAVKRTCLLPLCRNRNGLRKMFFGAYLNPYCQNADVCAPMLFGILKIWRGNGKSSPATNREQRWCPPRCKYWSAQLTSFLFFLSPLLPQPATTTQNWYQNGLWRRIMSVLSKIKVNKYACFERKTVVYISRAVFKKYAISPMALRNYESGDS
jgi:hypothetical protein